MYLWTLPFKKMFFMIFWCLKAAENKKRLTKLKDEVFSLNQRKKYVNLYAIQYKNPMKYVKKHKVSHPTWRTVLSKSWQDPFLVVALTFEGMYSTCHFIMEFFSAKKNQLDLFVQLSTKFFLYTDTEVYLEHWKTPYSAIFSSRVSNSTSEWLKVRSREKLFCL